MAFFDRSARRPLIVATPPPKLRLSLNERAAASVSLHHGRVLGNRSAGIPRFDWRELRERPVLSLALAAALRQLRVLHVLEPWAYIIVLGLVHISYDQQYERDYGKQHLAVQQQQ